MFWRCFLAVTVLFGVVVGTGANGEDSMAAQWCADFDGEAGNDFTSPLRFGGFEFDWDSAETGSVVETSAIGGDYLRVFSDVSVSLPLPSNAATIRVLSEGPSTTHDFVISAFDPSGAQVDSQSVHVGSASYLDVKLAAQNILEVRISGADAPMNEAGVQKVCIWVLAAP